MPSKSTLKWITIDDKKFEIKDLDKYTMKELKIALDMGYREIDEWSNFCIDLESELERRKSKKKK